MAGPEKPRAELDVLDARPNVALVVASHLEKGAAPHGAAVPGTARFASALGVADFVRRSHVIRFDRGAAARWAEAAAVIADVEGLPAHAAAARRRL